MQTDWKINMQNTALNMIPLCRRQCIFNQLSWTNQTERDIIISIPFQVTEDLLWQYFIEMKWLDSLFNFPSLLLVVLYAESWIICTGMSEYFCRMKDIYTAPIKRLHHFFFILLNVLRNYSLRVSIHIDPASLLAPGEELKNPGAIAASAYMRFHDRVA